MRKYEIFSWSIDQNISRVSDANECGILVNMRHEFHISKHPRIILVIIWKIAPLPFKNNVIIINNLAYAWDYNFY